MSLESCPTCGHRLNPPLQSTGRQICMKCGWTDKPRQGNGTAASSNPKAIPARPAAVDLTPMDIQKLLKEAAAESLTNMKPRWKRDKEANAKTPPSDPPLPPLDSL